MKTNTILAVLILTGGVTFAQQKPPTALPPGATPPLNATPGISTNRAPRQDENLSSEQRKAIDEATAKIRKEQQELGQKRMTLIKERSALEHSENIDEAGLRKKGEELGKIETDLSILRAHLNKEVRAHMPTNHVNLNTNGSASAFSTNPPPSRPSSAPVPAQRRPLPAQPSNTPK